MEARRHIKGGPQGQRHNRPDPGHRHQTPAHVIVADDDQQAAVQHGGLFAQHAPDHEQRFDQDGQIGMALNQFLDAGLELQLPNDPDLEAEVTVMAAQPALPCAARPL